jgi:hypothetical protein
MSSSVPSCGSGPTVDDLDSGSQAFDIVASPMTSRGRHLRVFLASPADVADERSRVERVVSELNRMIGDSEGVSLELIRWETHAWPGFGADAQDVINREMEPGDIFVGVLWRRIGTPTHRSASGTIEEFERARELWLRTGRPTMMLYFKTMPFYPSRDDLTQFSAVLDFKDRLRDKGALYWEYDGADEFETEIRVHLFREVQTQLRTYSRNVDENRSTRLVLGVLESSRNVGQGYRTLVGLAHATGLPEAEVKRVIDTSPEFVMKSRIPDRGGAALFKLRT